MSISREPGITNIIDSATKEFLRNVEGRLTLLSLALVSKRACREVSEAVGSINRAVQKNNKSKNEPTYCNRQTYDFGLRLTEKLGLFRENSSSIPSRMLNPYMVNFSFSLYVSLSMLQQMINYVIKGYEMYERFRPLNEKVKNNGALGIFGCDNNFPNATVVAECNDAISQSLAMALNEVPTIAMGQLTVILTFLTTSFSILGAVSYHPGLRDSLLGRRDQTILLTADEELVNLIQQFQSASPEAAKITTGEAEGAKTIVAFEKELISYLQAAYNTKANLLTRSDEEALTPNSLYFFSRHCQQLCSNLSDASHLLQLSKKII